MTKTLVWVTPEETVAKEGNTFYPAAEIDPSWTVNPYVAPPPPDYGQIDQDTLNAALIAEGSVVRALGMVMFAEINKLRVINGDTEYTLAQFKSALKNEMRT